jgi:uncharacterized repeat protein (TIGR03803 family)
MNRKILVTLIPMIVFALSFCEFPAHAQTFTTLYTFTGIPDGSYPTGTLLRDNGGNLYGTTQGGGNSSCMVEFIYGCGTVFEISSSGKETILHTFTNTSDGGGPVSGVVLDTSGDIYGTTNYGGTGQAGTIFKIDSSGSYSILYNFQSNGTQGQYPVGPLIRDASGNLYGTTSGIGGTGCGCGNVFELDTAGNLTVIYTMTGFYDDGSQPLGQLSRDADGNLYGTDSGGGDGFGTVFKVNSKGSETVLYSFKNLSDGADPWSGLLVDAQKKIAIGTAYSGGKSKAGTVYRINISGSVTPLYSFTGGSDGGNPAYGTLIQDSVGNLYGTASQGGIQNNNCQASSCGVVFELSPNGSGGYVEKVLHSFTGNSDGSNPIGGLIMDEAGNLYGTAASGGPNGSGTVFEISR